jgi:hypothetical protein
MCLRDWVQDCSRDNFKKVSDNMPHVLQELFIVVDQGTWSCVQRVAILNNKLRNLHVIMHGLMLRTCSRCPTRERHVQGHRLEGAMGMF